MSGTKIGGGEVLAEAIPSRPGGESKAQRRMVVVGHHATHIWDQWVPCKDGVWPANGEDMAFDSGPIAHAAQGTQSGAGAQSKQHVSRAQ